MSVWSCVNGHFTGKRHWNRVELVHALSLSTFCPCLGSNRLGGSWRCLFEKKNSFAPLHLSQKRGNLVNKIPSDQTEGLWQRFSKEKNHFLWEMRLNWTQNLHLLPGSVPAKCNKFRSLTVHHACVTVPWLWSPSGLCCVVVVHVKKSPVKIHPHRKKNSTSGQKNKSDTRPKYHQAWQTIEENRDARDRDIWPKRRVLRTSRASVAQLVRARDCQSLGRRFDSI